MREFHGKRGKLTAASLYLISQHHWAPARSRPHGALGARFAEPMFSKAAEGRARKSAVILK
jgi:hypothetical protein